MIKRTCCTYVAAVVLVALLHSAVALPPQITFPNAPPEPSTEPWQTDSTSLQQEQTPVQSPPQEALQGPAQPLPARLSPPPPRTPPAPPPRPSPPSPSPPLGKAPPPAPQPPPRNGTPVLYINASRSGTSTSRDISTNSTGTGIPSISSSSSSSSSSSTAGECGNNTFMLFSPCCSHIVNFSMTNINASGRLPDSFTLAQQFTDLSNNPRLCGTVSAVPARAQQAGPGSITKAPFNISNTNIQLDLGAAAAKDGLLGPRLAYWLAEDALQGSNMLGALPPAQGFQVCQLLQQGRLKVQRARYCSSRSNASCNCSAVAQTASTFGSAAAWEACHVAEAELAFDAGSRRDEVLQLYNQHLLQHGQLPWQIGAQPAAAACGQEGITYRRYVVLFTILVPLAAAVVAYIAYSLLHPFCMAPPAVPSYGEDPHKAQHTRHMWLYLLSSLLYFAVHAFDMLGDWMFLYGVASAGTWQPLILQGWLLMVPFLLWLFLNALSFDAVANSHSPCSTFLSAALLAVLIAAAGCTMCGLCTANIIRYVPDPSVVVPDDTLLLAYLFLGFTLPGQLAAVGMGLIFRRMALEEHHVADPEDRTFPPRQLFKVSAYQTELLMLLFQSIPQLVLQAVLWVRGDVALATSTYVISAAGSVASILLGLVSMKVEAYRNKEASYDEFWQRQLQWLAQQPAAWREQHREVLEQVAMDRPEHGMSQSTRAWWREVLRPATAAASRAASAIRHSFSHHHHHHHQPAGSQGYDIRKGGVQLAATRMSRPHRTSTSSQRQQPAGTGAAAATGSGPGLQAYMPPQQQALDRVPQQDQGHPAVHQLRATTPEQQRHYNPYRARAPTPPTDTIVEYSAPPVAAPPAARPGSGLLGRPRQTRSRPGSAARGDNSDDSVPLVLAP